MTFDDYQQYDATGLAILIASGQVSSAEVAEAAIAAIETLNPELNAVVTTLFTSVRASPGNQPGNAPFAGVPYLVKDLNTWMTGVTATNGSRAFRDFCPDHDSELITRLRRAGLVILGKTNTPELGLNVDTAPLLFGATRNPFDHSRSAGGSSGGSAAAVASGMVPAAHATDSGGSIRIPASNCGLFGLKPSRARVPLGNDAAEGLAGFSTVHALSHSVRDSARLLDATAGGMAGDIYSAPSHPRSFADALQQPLPKLRIALCRNGFAGERVDAQCQLAAANAALLCKSLGCEVEEVAVPVDGHALRHAFDVLFSANIRNVVASVAATRPGEALDSLFEPVTIAASESAGCYQASDYAAALQVTQQAARALGQFFQQHDVLITPTLANPPLPLGTIDMQSNNWREYLEQMLDEIPFTPLFNATGAPAASLPLAQTTDGLPIGVQFGAALGNEATLFCLAAAIEQAAPWHQRH